MQLVIILEFVYVVNEWLLEREKCAFTLVAATLLMIAGSFVGIGFLYHVRAAPPGRPLGQGALAHSCPHAAPAAKPCASRPGRSAALLAPPRPPAPAPGCSPAPRTGVPPAPSSLPCPQYYAPSSSCSLNIWFITSAILFFLVYAGISVSPLRHDSAGLFTSAAVYAYVTYYAWSALNSEPADDACAATSAGANKTIQIIGFVLAILAVRPRGTTLPRCCGAQAPSVRRRLAGAGAASQLILAHLAPAVGACRTAIRPDSLLLLLPPSLPALQLGFSTMSSGVSSQAFDLAKGTGTDDEQLPYRPDFCEALPAVHAVHLGRSAVRALACKNTSGVGNAVQLLGPSAGAWACVPGIALAP